MSLLSTVQTLHAHISRECISTQWLLNPGQPIPIFKGCVRQKLTTDLTLCVLPLYLICRGIMGYLCIPTCTHLTSTRVQPGFGGTGSLCRKTEHTKLRTRYDQNKTRNTPRVRLNIGNRGSKRHD